MAKPKIGSLWRRRSTPSFMVRVTKLERGDIHFEAVDRKPHQPTSGKKWAAYWLDAFEPCDDRLNSAASIAETQLTAAAHALRDRYNICGDDVGCQCEDAEERAREMATTVFAAAAASEITHG